MYKTWFSWLFDGDIKSPIPKGENVPDILKYNSPITHTYVISIFINNGQLNWFLNQYFNNMNLRYLSKEELFRFAKKCVIDFRVKRKSIPFIPHAKDDKLFTSLRRKAPMLKREGTNLLCKIIEESNDVDQIYSSLGIDKPEKRKLSWSKKKAKTSGKVTLKEFLSSNFSVMKV